MTRAFLAFQSYHNERIRTITVLLSAREEERSSKMHISNLKKTYGDRLVLDIPEYRFEKGVVYAVIGHNGSGKSTLGKILSGVEKADLPGSVCPEKGETIAYMPQKSYGFRMSVRKNILLAADNTPGSSQRSEMYMERLGLVDLAEKKANRLSGGETARMALARVLMTRRTFLILDEPTAAMDVQSVMVAEDLISEYRKETGAAIVLITQSFAQARRMAGQVVFMHGGRILETGIPEEVFDHPKTKEAETFLYVS